ncbi:MAG: MFS transporter [Pseudomonadota bacterium]
MTAATATMDMTANRWRLLLTCLLATFLISGGVATIGIVVPEAAARFGVSAPSMAATFSWFTVGIFAGNVISFVLFSYCSIRSVLLVGYGICAGSLLLIHSTSSGALLALALLSYGLSISCVICGAGTLITQLWDGRARQTALVAQDAMFNGGGLLFSAVVTGLVVRSLNFSWLYVLLAAFAVFALLLALLSDFGDGDAGRTDAAGPQTTEWNLTFVLLGVSLLVFMLGKISLFVWAPQLIDERFGGTGSGGLFMSNVFLAAFFGSLAGTWLVTRFAAGLLVYGLVLLSAAATFGVLRVENAALLLPLAIAYGFSVSATFNAYCAHALAKVGVPTHRNVAYLLLMSGLGGALAPVVSSRFVTGGDGIASGVLFSLGCTLTVILLLALSAWSGARRARTLPAEP